MKTLRQFAGHVGYPFASVSVRGVRQHSSHPHFLDSAVPSLRAMIKEIDGLTVPFDFSLQVGPQQGTAPLLVSTRYGAFKGRWIRGVLSNPPDFHFRVLQGGQVNRIANSLTGFDHKFTEGGTYVIEAAAQGVGSPGYARVVHAATVNVKNAPPAPSPAPAPTPPPVPQRPIVGVAYQGPPSGAKFTVTGSQFLANHVVHTRVVNTANLVTVFFDTTSDSSGRINQQISFPCAPGVNLAFSANDERDDPDDLSGTLFSNTFTLTVT